MKKISKIIIENFRVFSGTNEIDFNNRENIPADFICIFGKNGYGKTSLFDGLEWFFTGEIQLLKKDLKNNVSKYKGKILTCKYANGDNKGVGIKYSDGDEGYRKIIDRTNSINDYSKGNCTGTCKGVIDKKQILPHSKIDSFVYSTKPADMYKEWGNFWDPNNKERPIFQVVYQVYKKCRDDFNGLTSELSEVNNELEKINISEIISSVNNYIDEYNDSKIIAIPDISRIDIDRITSNELYLMQTERKIGDLIIDYKNSIEKNLYKYDYLIKNYSTYKQYINDLSDFEIKKNTLRNIILKCRQKKDLESKINNIEEKKKEQEASINNVLGLLNEIWFLKYSEYVEKKIQNQKYNDELKRYYYEISNIDDRKKILKADSDTCLHNKEQLTSKYIKYVNVQDEIAKIEDISIIKEKISVNKNLINLYDRECYILGLVLSNEGKVPLEGISESEFIQYTWLDELKKKTTVFDKKIDNAKKNKDKANQNYINMEKNVDNYNKLLLFAKKEIEGRDICYCPLCRSKFNDKNELLDKIDMSSQDELLLSFRTEFEKASEALNELENLYEVYLKRTSNKLGERNIALKNKINKCKNENSEFKQKCFVYEKLLQNKDLYKEEILNYISSSYFEEPKKYADVNFKNIYLRHIELLDKKISVNNDEISKLENKRKIVEEEHIKAIDLVVAENNDFIDKFLNDSLNQEKLKAMQACNIFSQENLSEYLKKREESIQEIVNEQNKLLDILNKYKIYYTTNIDKYEAAIFNLSVERDEVVATYIQYKKDLFGNKEISKKKILKCYNRQLDKLNLADKKYEIWDGGIYHSRMLGEIKNYKFLLARKNNIIEKITIANKKIIESKKLYDNLKIKMEEHIKNIFGGVTISQIYSKIEPHKRFTKLQYKVDFNENSAPELYIKVLNNQNEEILPELFFSSAQLNTVALSVFMGGALSTVNPKLHTIFIDDPVGHFDEMNVLSFVDILRTIVSTTDWQIVISTHEERFFELLKVKLNPTYYNSKFLKFKEEGCIEEDLT